MLEVIENGTGEILDVSGGIRYTFQAAEIGDISRINSNWSWTVNFPRSPKNEQIFQGLGLLNNKSLIPYSEILVTIRYNSIEIIKSGKLAINETNSDEYKGHVTNGISDFLSELSDLILAQLPEVLDPANELNHDRNLTNIENSWSVNGSTEVYKYIIANYNGELGADPNFTDFVSSFLLPSVNVKFLFDAIFNFVGWTYQGLPDINEDWITYGNRVEDSEEAGLQVGEFNFNIIRLSDFIITPGIGWTSYLTSWLEFVNSFEDSTYINQNTSTSISINTAGNYSLQTPRPTSISFSVQSCHLHVYINGSLFTRNNSTNWKNEFSVGSLNQNDSISFKFEVVTLPSIINSHPTNYIQFNNPFKVINTDVIVTDFQSKSLEIKARDFVKDIMIRYATSAFSDIDNKNIKFMDIDERVNAEIVDWTSKYQGRTSESYALDGYAQNNYIRHSYGNDNDEYHDGNLVVLNKNLNIDRTLYKSPFYSSDREAYLDEQNIEFIGFKSYDIEQTNTGEKITPLNDRFHYLRYQQRPTNEQIKINGTTFVNFDEAVTQNFSDTVPLRYDAINSLINRAKIVNIDLDLSAFDLKDLRLDVVYYFQQEAARFLLNKLTWDSENAISKGEFIKIQNA